MTIRLFLLLLSLAAWPAALAAQPVATIYDDTVIVCPADRGSAPPDFAAPQCREARFFDVDPQGRALWVRARLSLPPDLAVGEAPLGLFLSAKAASVVYLNGRRIGANGTPGHDAASETPGRMDAVFPIPPGLLRAENTVTLRMSTMHGFLRLSNPVHFVAIGPYGAPQREMLSRYLPALVTLGAFLLGALNFGIMAVRGEDREGSAIVAAASLFAGLQLAFESLRGLVAYSYPVHDLRLLAILVCAAGFGLALFAYLLRRFFGGSRWRRAAPVAALAAAMAIIALLVPGFDGKTWFSLAAAVAAGILAAIVAAWRGRRGAPITVLLLLALAAAMVHFRSSFLDAPVYVIAAGLLAFLFYHQATAIVAERALRRREERRADRLELALAQARNAQRPEQVELASASRTEFLPADRIVRFSGAGDYVEAHLAGGGTRLFDDSLARLEEALPETFIRIHRSHIVNTAFVRALERDAGGTGRLRLADGAEVPVSRRIMPAVRAALTSG